jgi:hypothetical protein
MAERSAATRAVVMAICLGVTALGLNNVYGGEPEIIRLGERAACGSPECTFNMLMKDRSPISTKFTFQVKTVEKGRERGATADVECKRSYMLVGEYSCAMTSGGLPPR